MRALWSDRPNCSHNVPQNEGQILTPTPTPEFLTKDFPSATRSRMETLTKKNLVEAKTAPTAVSRTSTPLVRETRFP